MVLLPEHQNRNIPIDDRTQTAGATAAVREFREWVRNR